MATTTSVPGSSFFRVPGRLWYVHADGSLDSSYGTRAEARARKSVLRSAGVRSVRLSSSVITVGSAVTDAHS